MFEKALKIARYTYPYRLCVAIRATPPPTETRDFVFTLHNWLMLLKVNFTTMWQTICFSDLALLWLRSIKKHLRHCNYDSMAKFGINFFLQR